MASYEEPAQAEAPKKNRTYAIAAIVAGVAIIGAVGVFGASFFGGDSDGPALVRADSDPLKVRPENPGGATVPNQDNQVYQRVANGSAEPAPTQESLISTAEEPVDVNARVAGETTLPPGVSDEVLAPTEEGPLMIPTDDRIEPGTGTAETGVAEEVAAVAPRRVRTMVVRPDGTMVPREEIAPAVEQPAQETVAAVPSVLDAAGALAPATGALEAPVGQPEEGPIVNTPQTVAVVPSRRVDPQAAVAPLQPTQQPQVPVATPVSAPAAAAPVAQGSSEWSMQIASQPTAEGAQAAYQDLARRYGNVLQGRGVNVVRADIEGMGTYYRVRIPASNRDEAIQLCTRYKAAGGSYFVSR